jgi:hypothetical protein
MYKIYILSRVFFEQDNTKELYAYIFRTSGTHQKLVHKVWLTKEVLDEAPKIADEFVLLGALHSYNEKYPEDEFAVDATREYETEAWIDGTLQP